MAIVSVFFLLSNCSGSGEYGEASDFEKYGANPLGTIKGSVQDTLGSVLSGVNVSYALSGKTTSAEVTDSSGDFSKSSINIGTYTLSYSKSGYLDDTQEAILEDGGQTLTVNTLKMNFDNCSETGDPSGTITDAVDSSAITEASLSVRKGSNNTTGTVIKTASTNASNGTYTLSDMPKGWYTMHVSKSGYLSQSFDVNSCGDIDEQDFSLSKSLSSGMMRIILKWPETSPMTGADLDSHLTGPLASGRFHVMYPTDNALIYYSTGNNACSGCSASQLSDNMTLDRDENPNATSAPPGQETITVRNVKSSGTYRYSVHNYTDKNATSSTFSDNLSKSGARVRFIYNNGSTTIKERYNVPNEPGTLWEVLTYTTSGGLVEERTMSYQSNKDNIQ